jgi:hypothetical protein
MFEGTDSVLNNESRESITTAKKSMLKLVKLQSLVARCFKMRKV